MTNREIYLLEPGDFITNDGKVLEFIEVSRFIRNRPYYITFKNVVTKDIHNISKIDLNGNWRILEPSHPQYKAIKVLYGTVKI